MGRVIQKILLLVFMTGLSVLQIGCGQFKASSQALSSQEKGALRSDDTEGANSGDIPGNTTNGSNNSGGNGTNGGGSTNGGGNGNTGGGSPNGGGNVSTPEVATGKLVQLNKIGTITEADIRNRAEAAGVPEFALEFLDIEQVDLYRVIYTTKNWNGSSVQASGLLIAPLEVRRDPLLVYLHGTISPQEREKTPSRGQSDEVFASAIIASLGFYILLPDYIGYGSTENLKHPYLHATSQARVSRDMLKASITALGQIGKSADLDDGVFIAGYSQGGQVGMHLHRLLETEGEYRVAISSLGAGPYDLEEAVKAAVAKDDGNTNEFMIWGLESLREIYATSVPNEEIYQSHIIPSLPKYLSGELNASRKFTEIFVPGFTNKLFSNGYPSLLSALRDQSAYANWTPRAPIRLYHGKKDRTVPFEVSQAALSYLSSRGADVELATNKAAHVDGVTRYTLETIVNLTAVRRNAPDLNYLRDLFEYLDDEELL